MIIDFAEGIETLKHQLVRTFEVDAAVYETDEGKTMIAQLTLAFVRRLYLTYLTNETLSESSLMSEMASICHAHKQHSAFDRMKQLSDLLMRYETAHDSSMYDDKPEGEASYVVSEFLEEAFREIEEIIMDVFRETFKEEGKEHVYQFSLPTGAAGHRMMKGVCVISSTSIFRGACGNRKTYQNIVSSIILN